MVILKKCTCLLGEDRHEDLQAALHELKGKRATLTHRHYGDVRFLLGYAAGGPHFQWCFLHGDADKVYLSVGCYCTHALIWFTGAVRVIAWTLCLHSIALHCNISET